MKKNKKRDEFLDQLRKIPIVLVACEKTALSRNTVYRWRKEDDAFAKAMEEALAEGEELVNDMSESQLLTMIKEKNWSAISFWLRKRNPKFKDRIEVEVAPKQEELSPDQEATVREALRLAGNLSVKETSYESTEHNSPGASGDDAEGSESAISHN